MPFTLFISPRPHGVDENVKPMGLTSITSSYLDHAVDKVSHSHPRSRRGFFAVLRPHEANKQTSTLMAIGVGTGVMCQPNGRWHAKC